MMDEFKGTPGPWEANCFLVVATSVDRQSIDGSNMVHITCDDTREAEE